MEMTVVAAGSSEMLQRTTARLAGIEWTAVVVQDAVAASIKDGDLPMVSARTRGRHAVVTDLDLERLIDNNPGGRVLVLCEPQRARDLAAEVLSVPATSVHAPEAASISRFRASRTGVRTVVSVNDTLHLATVAPVGVSERTNCSND